MTAAAKSTPTTPPTNTKAIIGLQWGDEGKGKIVDWLSPHYQHVARFQGGHNAGHTILHGGQKTVLHLLPSGVLHAQTQCYIGNGVVLSLPDLLREIREIEAQGIALAGRLWVATAAALILPYHIALDTVRERKHKIGTTRRGIGPAHEDKIGRRAVRVYDLLSADGRDKIRANLYHHQAELASGANGTDSGDDAEPSDTAGALDADAIWRGLQEQLAALRPYLCDSVATRLQAAATAGESILLEGAQGSLLDIEHGTYPYTTSAACIAAAATSGLGIELHPQVFGITKAYSTRVGNGPFPTELAEDDAAGKALSQAGNEFGATTGRARRCGWLDLPMLRHAVRLNGCRQLIITKLDVLDGFDSILVCTAYQLDGKTLRYPPASPHALARCQPVYEALPGWRGESTANARSLAALPAAARDYINYLQEQCGAHIAAISTGADREAMVLPSGDTTI